MTSPEGPKPGPEKLNPDKPGRIHRTVDRVVDTVADVAHGITHSKLARGGAAAAVGITGVVAEVAPQSAGATLLDKPAAIASAPAHTTPLSFEDLNRSLAQDFGATIKIPQGENNKDKGGEQTERKKKANNQETLTVAEQIKAAANSVHEVLTMTPEEFHQWATKEDKNGQDNRMYILDGNVPLSQTPYYNFPTLLNSDIISFYTPVYYLINKDQTHKYPMQENLGLTTYSRENGLWNSGAFENASITVNLESLPGDSVTVTIATSRYGDGRSIPYVAITNIESPDNALFGPNNALFTDTPVAYHTSSRNNASTYLSTGKSMSREQFKSELKANIGKPIIVMPLGNRQLQTWGSDFAQGTSIDVRISDRKLNRQLDQHLIKKMKQIKR